MATTGKTVEMIFETVIETYEHQTAMLDLVDTFTPDSAAMQNSNNVVWRNAQQHAPIIDGWDTSGQETTIIQETYPAILGIPANDVFQQRADDMRDMQFWKNRAEESGKKQATELNKRVVNMIMNTGSLFYRTNAASGFDAIAEAESILDERQSASDDRYMMLNTRDNQKYASDLAGRQTLQGRPETAWAKTQVGQNVAGFDVYRGSFLPNLAGGANPATTVTADVSHKPEGGTVDALTHVVTNIDYRVGTISVTATASYAAGDKVIFTNPAGVVQSIGLADKTLSDQAMTFTIVEIVDATTVKVFPKPIALDDPGLTTLEKAYANIDTQILNTATMDRLNTDATAKVSAFWCKNSIEVTKGDAPITFLQEFAGQKVISSTMSNGQTMYMAYDGDIDTMQFKCRLFTWYGITNKNPMANGCFVSY